MDEQGMNLEPQILIDTQANIIAQNAVRLTQLEAAVNQLRAENYQLRQSLAQRDDTEVVDEFAEALPETEGDQSHE